METPAEWKNRLGSIIDNIELEGQFACSGGDCEGDITEPLPKLYVTGVGSIRLPLRSDQAAALLAAGQPAPYGKGPNTVLDPAVRRATQLDASVVQANPEWETTLQDITADIASGLGIDAIADVQARLYKLLLYQPGGHFVAHRDTEKEPGMFATLVVQLPVEGGHTGGTLRVTHCGQTFEWDSAAVSRKGQLSYAAFYADCEHELTAVTSGLRMVLTYNLVRVTPGSPMRAPSGVASESQEALEAVVRTWKDTPAADRLVAIPLEHKYTKANLSFSRLKGRDAAVVGLLAGCDLLDVNLALVTKQVIGSVAFDFCAWKRRERNRRRYGWGCCGRKRSHWSDDVEETWLSDEYEYDEELSDDGADAEMDDIIDEEVKIEKWVSLNGQHDEPEHSDCSDQDDELGHFDLWALNRKTAHPEFDFDDCLLRGDGLFDEDADPDDREYEGYTGNAGPTLNFWYHRAVVVVWPRAFTATLACAGGFRAAVEKLEQQVEKLTSQSARGATSAPSQGLSYTWQQPKRASVNRDALLVEFKQLLDAVLEIAETAPSKAFPGAARAAVNAELGLSFAASAPVLELAGSSVVCRFTAALAKSEGLASDSVVHALAAATAAVADPALADSVLALVKKFAVDQFARCAQLAQDPAVPGALRGRLAQKLMLTALGPTFKQLAPKYVLLMARLVCEGGPAFTQHQAAFAKALLGRPDSQALLQALLREPCVVQGVVAGAPSLVALLTVRQQALAEPLSKGPPKVNWVQPRASFPAYPQIEAFLRGPQQQTTFSGIFRGIPEARNWAACHFEHGHQRKYGFSARADAGGRGRNAFVTITKYNREYEDAALKYNEAVREFRALQALASSAGRTAAGATDPTAREARAAVVTAGATRPAASVAAASVRGGDPANSSWSGAVAIASTRLPLSAPASAPSVIDLTG